MFQREPNTIRLLHADDRIYTGSEEYTPGAAIWGLDNDPEIVKVWGIDQMEEAQQELALHRCTHTYHAPGKYHYVEEWALEICICNEEGEVEEGSDYWLAPDSGNSI